MPGSRAMMEMAFKLRDAAPVFEDAETLSVSQYNGYTLYATIEARSTRGRECTVILHHRSSLHYDKVSGALAGTIHANSAQLGCLCVFSTPVTMLDALFNPPPALPVLRALTVLVEKWAPELPIMVQMTHVEGYGSQFPSGSLACLLDTQDMALTHIDIVASTSAGSLEESDLEGLLDTLEKSLSPRSQEDEVVVVVRGFRSDFVAHVALPRVHRYSITLLASENTRRRST
ncbi:hypothetical protein AURDEDRAFT_130291 [Auricularia subglabra TFB-10046 SS5]|uniref:Uncharacterized protein n=1 Tax=Auricularia subglabra (strain TFB-10046 / SS5) TaxID=717982 RepID=J0LFD9_AURST|nr:hypothetical protein AURDEDRAFT_130291 [Auricularia subglabra TFB-10046 SS5]